jgi:hypothetical protein
LRSKIKARRLRLPGIDLLLKRNSLHKLSEMMANYQLAGMGTGASRQTLRF